MNFRIKLLIFVFFLIIGCNQHSNKNKNIEFTKFEKYSNIGFALVYNDDLKKNKKISKKAKF